MPEIFKKKIHSLITYPVLILFSISVVFTFSFFYVKSNTFAQTLLLQPFEGNITQVDYVTCVCSLAMIVTIEPSLDNSQQQEIEALFYYAPQILSDLLGIEFTIGGIEFIPRLYEHYQLFYPGSQVLLGNYVPYDWFPCFSYAGTSCTYEGVYPAIFHVGTSLY